jgi:hypothetical protein
MRRRPLDAINPDALKGRTPPPKTEMAPKRKLTPAEIVERMKKVNPPNKPDMPKKYAKGGSVSSASKRADGVAMKGKTKGKFV